MKKRILAFISGTTSLTLIILNSVGTFKLCGGVNYGSCMDIVSDVMIVFSLFFPLFLFSLITYKMREESFQAWWKLARVWIPASMLAIIIAPSYASSWLFPIEKGNVAVFLSLGFFIASALLLISNSYLSGKGKILSAGHIFIIAGFSLFASLALLISLARAL